MSLIKIAFIAVLISPSLALAVDLAREQRIAEQIEEAIFDGETLYLQDGDHPFLSIYMRTDHEPRLGGVIVVHGLAANPDWVDVIHPLRTTLPEHGWDTLSIQVPVAREAASEQEWAETVPAAIPRFEAALAFLKQQEIENVAIVAHSHGARMAAHYLAEKQPPEISAFVAIGMGADPAFPKEGNLGALRKLKLPLLDLYGEHDLPQVKDTLRDRRLATQDAENPDYEQSEIAGADHFFANHNPLLVARVRAWLANKANP